ncbi:hypothetical protein [Legionella pneumophila]|uniref:hypothetical protein n=1 Tax=Legionella pneumophila TaxID=446 RepID=UPI00077BAD3C|nr:hypothetical protein [Legionella pneumophila]
MYDAPRGRGKWENLCKDNELAIYGKTVPIPSDHVILLGCYYAPKTLRGKSSLDFAWRGLILIN